MKKALLLLLLGVCATAFADTTLFRYEGSLDSGDARLLDGSYVDQFAIPVDDWSSVAILAVSVDFQPRIEIVVDGDDAAWVVHPDRPGTARAVARAEDAVVTVRVYGRPLDRGEYALRVYETDEGVEIADESGGR